MNGNFIAIAATVIWAATFPAAEALLETWPPIALMVMRIALALAVLFPLWWYLEGPDAMQVVDWDRALLIGGIGFGYGMYLMLVTQSLTDPITIAVIVACTPVAATAIEVMNGLRKISWLFACGLAATVLGATIATRGGDAVDFGLGLVCGLGSIFLMSWGSLASVRDFPEQTALGRATATIFGAFVMVNLLYVIHGLAGMDVAPEARLDLRQAGNMFVYAIVGLAVSQLLFLSAVRYLGVAVTAFHMNMIPFYLMLMLLAYGETFDWQRALGAAIVAAGVILSQIRTRDFKKLFTRRGEP